MGNHEYHLSIYVLSVLKLNRTFSDTLYLFIGIYNTVFITISVHCEPFLSESDLRGPP